jgi:Carboxypeptidase regulatory-like domain
MPDRADFLPLSLHHLHAERLFSTERPRWPGLPGPTRWEIPSRFRRRIGRCIGASVLLSGLLAAPCLFIALPSTAMAQTAERVVQGKVELASGGMAKGAIVYIKNGKTLEVRTYISTADGSYRFGQLNPDANYTVWAEYQGKKSKERTISSFDTKKVFNIPLKIAG